MGTPITASKMLTRTRTNYWMVPTLTESAPTLAQVNSVSGLFVTGFLLSDQATPSMETSKVELPRIMLESATSEVLDTQKVTVPDYRFLWDPQAAASADDKKAWALLKAGFDGYLVRRSNKAAAGSDLLVANDFIDWFKVQSAEPMPTETSQDASGLYVFDVALSCTRWKLDVQVAA